MDFNVAIKMIEILEKNGIKTPEELEKIFPSTKITDDYPTLATIKVGDSRDMRRVLEDKKTNIVRLAEDLMNQKAYKDSIETKEATVDLCSATVKELTGKDRAVLYQIIDAVINKGFGLCKPEDCLRLREAYYGGKTYIIAMDPICGSLLTVICAVFGSMRTLVVSRESGMVTAGSFSVVALQSRHSYTTEY